MEMCFIEHILHCIIVFDNQPKSTNKMLHLCFLAAIFIGLGASRINLADTGKIPAVRNISHLLTHFFDSSGIVGRELLSRLAAWADT